MCLTRSNITRCIEIVRRPLARRSIERSVDAVVHHSFAHRNCNVFIKIIHRLFTHHNIIKMLGGDVFRVNHIDFLLNGIFFHFARFMVRGSNIDHRSSSRFL